MSTSRLTRPPPGPTTSRSGRGSCWPTAGDAAEGRDKEVLMGLMRKLLPVTVLVLALLQGSALAANTTSVVSGTVGSEVSVVAATPSAMVLTHATPGTTASLVTVTSTQPSWTLEIASADATTGHMDRVTGSGP